MSGGTLGTILRRKAEREERERKVIDACEQEQKLRRNREEIIAEVCRTFGWSELDEFAEKMIEQAFYGQVVDIGKLKADLAAWKESQKLPEQDNDAVSP